MSSNHLLFFLLAVGSISLSLLLCFHVAERFDMKTQSGSHAEDRRMVPHLGGIAVLLGIGSNIFFGELFLDPGLLGRILHFWPLLVATLLLVLLGLRDDSRPISPIAKLTWQCIAAASVVTLVPEFRVPSFFFLKLGPFADSVFSFLFPILWILLVTNAVGIVDGIDGLGGTVILFPLITLYIICGAPQESLVLLASCVLPLVLFLFFNLPPARMFLGNNGSSGLGFCLACVSLIALQHQTLGSRPLSLTLAFLYPLTDFFFALVRRLLAQKNPFAGDQHHIHHRLVKYYGDSRKALIVLASAILISQVGALYASLTIGPSIVLWLLAFGLLVGFVSNSYLMPPNDRKKRTLPSN